MFHAITFTRAFVADLSTSRTRRLDRLRVSPGTHIDAQVRPYVAESDYGPVEVADLTFADGTLLAVPFASFTFEH